MALALLLAQWQWIAHDFRPLNVDELLHLGKVIGEPGPGVDLNYPPLVHRLLRLVLAPAFDWDQALVALAAFLPLLVVGTYATARAFLSSDEALVASFWAGTMPLVSFYSHNLNLDIPMTALVLLALACLVRSGAFTHAGWTLAFGACSGLAIAAKWPALVFLGPSAALVLASRRPQPRTALGVALALGACLLVLWPALGPDHFRGLGTVYFADWSGGGRTEGDPPPKSLASQLYYPWCLLFMTGALGYFLVPLGLVQAFRKPWWPLLGPFLGVAAMGWQWNKEPRYIMAALPVAAVLGLAGLFASGLGKGWIRALVAALLVLGWLQAVGGAFWPDPRMELTGPNCMAYVEGGRFTWKSFLPTGQVPLVGQACQAPPPSGLERLRAELRLRKPRTIWDLRGLPEAWALHFWAQQDGLGETRWVPVGGAEEPRDWDLVLATVPAEGEERLLDLKIPGWRELPCLVRVPLGKGRALLFGRPEARGKRPEPSP